MVLCASALPEKHKVNYQYCLQDDYCRNAVFKLIVQRFMMPDFHSQPCSDASACQGKQDERCLGNAAPLLFCLQLVYSVYNER